MVEIASLPAGAISGHGPARQSAQGDQPASAFGYLVLALFMLTMILPVSFEIADMRLTPQRFLLLLVTPFLSMALIRQRLVRIGTTDLLILFFCFWIGLTILINDGFENYPLATISIVEVLGGYLLGRLLVRNAASYKWTWNLHLVCLLILAPFAMIELVTHREAFTEFLSRFGDVVWKGPSSRPRWGLARVIAGFDHPILFGLFCSLGVANAFYIWRRSLIQGVSRLVIVSGMTFMALSSGALLSIAFQVILMVWGWITRDRWVLLACTFISCIISLYILSNRGPVILLIETATFNAQNGWTRVLQWHLATAEVMRHPWLGQGIFFTWLRPVWVSESVDSFWLVIALRHGLTGITLLALVLISIVWKLVRTSGLDAATRAKRTGYLITFIGLCFTLTTVHIWNAVSVFVFFYLGIGLWMTENGDAKRQDTGEPDRQSTSPRRQIYSRFTPPLGDDVNGQLHQRTRPDQRRPQR